MKKDRYVSILVLGLCFFWWVSSQSIPPATMPGAPGPRFFPYLVIGLLSLFAVIQLVLTLVPRKEVTSTSPVVPIQPLPSQPEDEDQEGGCVDPDDLIPERRYLFASFVLILAYVIGIDFLGFYPATVPAVFFALFIALKGKTLWYKVLLGTLLITGSIYTVFTFALKVPLPSGKLW